MKFASYMMIFDQTKWIMRNIENTYPHVDHMYILYSKLPWGYNPDARKVYNNTFDLSIIRNSKYMDKITIIEGDWMTDAIERTAALDYARKDGVDFLMAHDTDEFYFHSDFDKIKYAVLNNPDYDAYNINYYVFWKSFKYILIDAQKGRIGSTGQKVVNVHTTFKHHEEGLSTYPERSALITDVICYHASYVLSDEELYKKIKVWTHTNDFDVDKWYNEVWLAWTPESKNLHPVWPWVWSHCEEFNDPLPEVIADLQ